MAARHDNVAFQRIYELYCDRVYARLTRTLGPIPDREDVMQQVFLQLHQALPTFRGEASLLTFLFRITTFVSCDYLRKCGRRVVAIDGAGLESFIDDYTPPDDQCRAKQELENIFRLLQYVPPEWRLAFQLVVVEGLSLDDAAYQLGSDAKTVRYGVLRAKRKLLELLERAEQRPFFLRRRRAVGERP